jgi:hypothetical protein
VTKPKTGVAGRDASRSVVPTRRNARLVAVVTRLSKLFNTGRQCPRVYRGNKLVIPQKSGDPAPDSEVASRHREIGCRGGYLQLSTGSMQTPAVPVPDAMHRDKPRQLGPLAVSQG